MSRPHPGSPPRADLASPLRRARTELASVQGPPPAPLRWGPRASGCQTAFRFPGACLLRGTLSLPSAPLPFPPLLHPIRPSSPLPLSLLQGKLSRCWHPGWEWGCAGSLRLPPRAPKGSPLWLHLDPRWRSAPSWAAQACVRQGRKGWSLEPLKCPLSNQQPQEPSAKHPLPCDPACPSLPCPEAAISIPGDSSVFMFHPGLPTAEPPPGPAGPEKGSWDQVLLLCASSRPGRCDSCIVGSASPCSCWVLELACGIWGTQLPGRASLGCLLCWQGCVQVVLETLA